MSLEENEALVRRIYEFSNRKDIDGLYSLVTPDYVFHMTNRDLPLEQAKQFEAAFYEEYSDLNVTVHNMIAEGDMVAVRVTWRGTQKSTGKKLEITNANFIRVENRKWAETWNITDNRMAQQLGAIPKQ